DNDYVSTSGVLTFATGQKTATIQVQIKGDRRGESNETFFVNLSNANGAVIADGQGVGTILDDERRITINDVILSEGNSGTARYSFPARLSPAYDSPVTVHFATANGTARASNRDYVSKAGTLTFAPGQTSKTISVSVRGDRQHEANETFFVDL